MTAQEALAAQAEVALESVRDALGRIEEMAQKDDDPRWLDLSRRFAMLVSPIREFLNAFQMRRALPQTLAHRLDPLLAELDEVSDLVARAGVGSELLMVQALAREARASSP